MAAALAKRDQKIKAVELAAIHGVWQTADVLKMPRETLRSWCYRDFRKEYSEFRAGKLSEWRQSFAAEMEDLQQEYAVTEAMALEAARAEIETGELEAKDLASLIKGMGAARASATSTATRARGEPDRIEEHRVQFDKLNEAAEAILARYGPPPAIDGTAVEVTEELDAGPTP